MEIPCEYCIVLALCNSRICDNLTMYANVHILANNCKLLYDYIQGKYLTYLEDRFDPNYFENACGFFERLRSKKD